MTESDKAYIAQYSRKTTFEMAKAPGQYEPEPCYLVGSIAIHRDGKEWKLSHAGTGMGLPGIFGRTIVEAVRVARSIDACVSWDEIKRTKTVGVVRGFTSAKKQALFAMAVSFAHIDERRSRVRRAVSA